MPNICTLSRKIRRAALLLTLLLTLLLAAAPPGPVHAQIGGPLTAGADDEPIRIQADSGIEWQQNSRLYIARGNAVAARGANEVRADTLIAHYREKAAAGGGSGTQEGGGNTEIFRVEAIGNVRLTRDANTVTGDRAVYDVDQGIAVVTGKGLKLTTATDVVTARDSLEWHDQRQIAVARGDAVASRAGKTIRADILTAHLQKVSQPQAKSGRPDGRRAGGAASPATLAAASAGGPGAESKISRVDAQGHVVITNGPDSGRGDYGVYNGETGIATLIGNVVLQRGNNVLRGQRGVMDLNNNIARMMSGGAPGDGSRRVQGLFVRDPQGQGTLLPGGAPERTRGGDGKRP